MQVICHCQHGSMMVTQILDCRVCHVSLLRYSVTEEYAVPYGDTDDEEWRISADGEVDMHLVKARFRQI